MSMNAVIPEIVHSCGDVASVAMSSLVGAMVKLGHAEALR